MVRSKAVSAIKKVFLQDNFDRLDSISTLKCAKGERVSFQIVIKNEHPDGRKIYSTFNVCDEFKKHTEMYEVGHVPVHFPTYIGTDDNYLSKTPGLYPDVLYPIDDKKQVLGGVLALSSVWFTVTVPKNIKAGLHKLTVEVDSSYNDEHFSSKIELTLDVKKFVMPQNDLIYTQWFHCDCIADYYGVPMMSKKHWHYIEQFMKTAKKTGITMILTPLFTPPLDTVIGGERPTMQLVKVKKTGDRYDFSFELLDKWVSLCHKYGINYFELSHLFTQWGAGFCPKIVVNEDGEDKKLFGWHTESTGDMYKNFLSQFLPALTTHLKELGIADNCYFHISDEPSLKPDRPDFKNYSAIHEFIAPYIKGFKLMDAISDTEYYTNALVSVPVPFIGHIEPFLKLDIKERWCYYCSSKVHHLPDRFMAMPSSRTRVLGALMFMNDMVGFLQWGFNFYYINRARYKIDPYMVTDGEDAWPSGNAFSVYPDKNGGPALESIRTKVFYEGIQDRMLLKALADRIGLEKAKEFAKTVAGGKLNGFLEYPTEDSFVLDLHDKILDILG